MPATLVVSIFKFNFRLKEMYYSEFWRPKKTSKSCAISSIATS
jgi:hypothetical protein